MTVNVVGTDGTTSGPIMWFVNNNAGACPASPCDGRLSHPFQTLADFDTANAAGSATTPKDGDAAFLYESATTYQGPLTLRAACPVDLMASVPPWRARFVVSRCCVERALERAAIAPIMRSANALHSLRTRNPAMSAKVCSGQGRRRMVARQ